MYQHYYLRFIICAVFYVAKCEVDVYIIPSQDVQCPDRSSCFTLAEMLSNIGHITDNSNMTTLFFQPGNHSLDLNLTISNTTDFSMFSNDTLLDSTSIVCKNSGLISFVDVGTIELVGLEFVGCGLTSFTRCDKLTIRNCTFKRGNETTGGRTLVLNDIADGRIEECSFVFNTLRSNDIKIPHFGNLNVSSSVNFGPQTRSPSALDGGAIHSSSSFTVIERSTFYENEAQYYGGAIFADQNSRIIIDECTFSHNKAVGLPFGDCETSSSGGGALFVKDSKIDIYNSTFTNNSLRVNPGCHGRGGVMFVSNSEVDIKESDFKSNTITSDNGTGGVMYVSNSTSLLVSQCSFTGNGAHVAGVMHIERSNASVTQSVFYNNVGYDQSGVISITQNSNTEFENCNFTNNTAKILGGVFYIASSSVIMDNGYFHNNSVDNVGAVMVILENADVRISSTTLANNKANLAVVSIYNSVVFSTSNIFVENQGSLLAFNSTVYFKGETFFLRCVAGVSDAILQEGGAISAYSSHLIFQNRTLLVLNSAKFGGALFIVESTILLSGELLELADTQLIIATNAAANAGGAIYLYHSFLTIREAYLRIDSNSATKSGGGIHAINSDIKIEFQSGNDSLVLAKNRAELGGAIHLVGASRLSIPPSVNSMRLTENNAEFGAAIYVDDETIFDTCFTTRANVTPASECFMNIINPYTATQTMPIETHIQHITMEDNHAEQTGSDLYGGLLDRCRPNTLFSDISTTLLTGRITKHDTDGLIYFQNISEIKDTNSISSRPTKVCFCMEGTSVYNCNLRELSVRVQKGEIFNIPVVAVDQAGSPVPSRIFSSISDLYKSRLASGQRARVSDVCTHISYSVLSFFDSERITLFADGPCRNASPSQLTINVTFYPCSCPVGFQHSQNDTSCECECDPLISEHITKCDMVTQTFVRKASSWIDYVIENNQTVYVIANRCPFRYCKNPPDAIEINLNDRFGANAQCSDGHTGTICGVCSTNFSVSLAHKRCLHCSDNWYWLFIVVCIGTIIAGLALVIAILVINFTVAVGTINGFIFYANIVDVYDSTFLPLSTSSFPVLIIEWLNLDPGFDICFVQGIDLYGHTLVRYIFPAYIIVIIIVIIVISEHSIRFSKLIGMRNPISTLATLLYLSFTNVLETAVVSLRPITLTYISRNGPRQETVWLPDGDLKYLHGKHIPMFLVAFILVLMTVGYIMLLISWQWMTKLSKYRLFKWTKNQKMKCFMEAYYAPYCDKHRYWTGLLLLIRVLLILISISTEGTGPTIPLLATIFCLGAIFLLRMTYAKKLYKYWPVEILETAMLFNLFLYAIFMWYALDNLKARMIIAYISTSIAFVLIVCVIGYHVYFYVLIDIFPKLKINKVARLRALMLAPAGNPTSNVNNLETTRGQEDRFYEMVGTASMHDSRSVRLHELVQNRQGPTFSVLETPYINAEQEDETDFYTSESTNRKVSLTCNSI